MESGHVGFTGTADRDSGYLCDGGKKGNPSIYVTAAEMFAPAQFVFGELVKSSIGGHN